MNEMNAQNNLSIQLFYTATARQSVQKMETRGNRSESFYFVLKQHILMFLMIPEGVHSF
jgi:hypothetical protein